LCKWSVDPVSLIKENIPSGDIFSSGEISTRSPLKQLLISLQVLRQVIGNRQIFQVIGAVIGVVEVLVMDL
jgi:hypothetical protein